MSISQKERINLEAVCPRELRALDNAMPGNDASDIANTIAPLMRRCAQILSQTGETTPHAVPAYNNVLIMSIRFYGRTTCAEARKIVQDEWERSFIERDNRGAFLRMCALANVWDGDLLSPAVWKYLENPKCDLRVLHAFCYAVYHSKDAGMCRKLRSLAGKIEDFERKRYVLVTLGHLRQSEPATSAPDGLPDEPATKPPTPIDINEVFGIDN